MASILLLNKPFNTLCQFTDKDGRQTLANYIDVKQFKHYYPAGRLDYDSEGLVALTDNGALQHRLANPQFKLPKTYWVQVEGEVLSAQLHALQAGPLLNDGPTKPCKAKTIDPPALWPRNPPIRARAAIPTNWIEIILTEGRNRQIRRMTAAVGLPTLRLVRMAIGPWTLDNLALGTTRTEEVYMANTGTPKPFPKHRTLKPRRIP